MLAGFLSIPLCLCHSKSLTSHQINGQSSLVFPSRIDCSIECHNRVFLPCLLSLAGLRPDRLFPLAIVIDRGSDGFMFVLDLFCFAWLDCFAISTPPLQDSFFFLLQYFSFFLS